MRENTRWGARDGGKRNKTEEEGVSERASGENHGARTKDGDKTRQERREAAGRRNGGRRV